MRLAALSTLALVSLAACSLPQGGEAGRTFIASNRLEVHATGPQSFRVDPGAWGLTGATDYWCAAGEYAQQVLGQDPAVFVYRTSPPPRHAGEGIDFSLSPAHAQKSGVFRVGNSNEGFRVGEATSSFCNERPMGPVWRVK